MLCPCDALSGVRCRVLWFSLLLVTLKNLFFAVFLSPLQLNPFFLIFSTVLNVVLSDFYFVVPVLSWLKFGWHFYRPVGWCHPGSDLWGLPCFSQFWKFDCELFLASFRISSLKWTRTLTGIPWCPVEKKWNEFPVGTFLITFCSPSLS